MVSYNGSIAAIIFIGCVTIALVTFGVIFYMSKKNGKRDLTKFTIVAGLILAAAFGVILFFAMKIQIANILQ